MPMEKRAGAGLRSRQFFSVRKTLPEHACTQYRPTADCESARLDSARSNETDSARVLLDPASAKETLQRNDLRGDQCLIETIGDVEREVQRSNEEARVRKLLTRKPLVQPFLEKPIREIKEMDKRQAPNREVVSAKVSRRMQNNLKQKHAKRRSADKEQQQHDEEFRKVLKLMQPMCDDNGTTIREDLDCLESVKALKAELEAERRRGKRKPRRAATQTELFIADALLGTCHKRA